MRGAYLVCPKYTTITTHDLPIFRDGVAFLECARRREDTQMANIELYRGRRSKKSNALMIEMCTLKLIEFYHPITRCVKKKHQTVQPHRACT